MSVVFHAGIDSSGATRWCLFINAGNPMDLRCLPTRFPGVDLSPNPVRNNEGLLIPGRANDEDHQGRKAEPVAVPVEELEGACPGAASRIRLRYGTDADLRDAIATDWVEVSAENDFIHQFKLTGLKPGTRYHYASETCTRVLEAASRYRRPGSRAAPPSHPANSSA